MGDFAGAWRKIRIMRVVTGGNGASPVSLMMQCSRYNA